MIPVYQKEKDLIHTLEISHASYEMEIFYIFLYSLGYSEKQTGKAEYFFWLWIGYLSSQKK